MSIIQSVFSTSDINTAINHEPRMQDLCLAEALGFLHPRQIRRLIKTHQTPLESFGGLVCTASVQTPQGGRPGKEYWLTKKQCLYLCTKSETPNATDVTIQMVDVFDQVTNGGVVSVRGYVRRKPIKNKIAHWKMRLQEARDRLADLGYVEPIEQYTHQDRRLATEMFEVKGQLDDIFNRIYAAGGLPAPADIARSISAGKRHA